MALRNIVEGNTWRNEWLRVSTSEPRNPRDKSCGREWEIKIIIILFSFVGRNDWRKRDEESTADEFVSNSIYI